LSVSPTLIQIYCTVLYCPPFCSVVLFMPPPQYLPSRTKLYVYAPAERADILPLFLLYP
jgi:hypothetical protein